MVGQTVSIVPGPALGTQLKHYNFMVVMSRGERLCESVPLLPNLLSERTPIPAKLQQLYKLFFCRRHTVGRYSFNFERKLFEPGLSQYHIFTE